MAWRGDHPRSFRIFAFDVRVDAVAKVTAAEPNQRRVATRDFSSKADPCVLRVPREADDRVSLGGELPYEAPAEHARRTRNEHPHAFFASVRKLV